METKQNEWVTVNIMARRKLKRETEKANLFSIPEHKGLSVWISKKCIHGSRNGKMLAVGIKWWIYNMNIWRWQQTTFKKWNLTRSNFNQSVSSGI